MCGICGKVYCDPQYAVNEHLIRRMCAVLQHRGPDEHGVYINGHVGFGHRRLSIIDLETGQQPMGNVRQDIRITYNGEIYNFPELRKSLEDRGYTFYTTCDTEVIIQLYDLYGTDCVKHLRGMFAFAIWDKRRQRLLLARDRVGQKPLFYLLTNTFLAFASEMKALLEDPTYHRELNLTALYHYLTYQYIPPPDTIFQHIRKLPPAHILVYEHGTTTIEQYWDLRYVPKQALDEQECIEETTTRLQESVKMRMLSDVPIGTFLSGGIDSSLVVAMMSQYTDHPLKTFSIGFREKQFNELPYARLIAERYRTEHYECIVEPDAVEVLPKLIWHFDEPFADPAAIPTYYLAKMTAQHVKVALNGDGGDESFAGYRRYLGHRRAHYFSLLPLSIRRSLLVPWLNMMTEKSGHGSIAALLNYLSFLNTLSLQSKEQRYVRGMTIYDDDSKFNLLSDDVRCQLQQLNSQEYTYQYFRSNNAHHFTDKMLYADVMAYLPGALLVKIDRMTMAFGLEGRSPFLDHKLMEFVASVPVELKVRGTRLKYLLHQVGKTWLPDTILTRKKQGFMVPLAVWFRRELHDMLHDLFSSSALVEDGICKKVTIQRMLDEHQTGTKEHPHRIWLLLNLELWYRMFIRNG